MLNFITMWALTSFTTKVYCIRIWVNGGKLWPVSTKPSKNHSKITGATIIWEDLISHVYRTLDKRWVIALRPSIWRTVNQILIYWDRGASRLRGRAATHSEISNLTLVSGPKTKAFTHTQVNCCLKMELLKMQLLHSIMSLSLNAYQTKMRSWLKGKLFSCLVDSKKPVLKC